MGNWANYFISTAATSGALIGLLFVSLSINLETVIKFPSLPYRALKNLALLLVILVISLLSLIPDQGVFLFGIETLVWGIAIWGTCNYLNWKRTLHVPAKYRKSASRWIEPIGDQWIGLSYVIAGFELISGSTNGFYWLVPATLLSFLNSLIASWVLLVEVKR